MKYGLIGEHLSHSFSKEVHNLIGNNDYILKEISRDNLDSFLKAKKFKGINVTIPYKEKSIPYLDYMSDEVKVTNSVNTIVNKDNKLYGYNTDILGLEEALKKYEIDIKNKNVLILGRGGVSKSIDYLLNKYKARKVYHASRSAKEDAISYSDINSISNDIDIIFNASPNGMYPLVNEAPLIDLSMFNKLEAFIDLIYNPLNTNLIISAKDRGIKAINGLYMLVSQAIYSYSFFMNKEYSKKLCDEIYEKIYKSKINIALIGMPSSGKSVIAKELSKRLKKDSIDTDKIIKNRIKISIKDYFSKFGEDSFRDIEKDVIDEVSLKNNLIISTGGGVIKREENIINLKRNSIIIFINRPLEKLVATENRPLSSNKEDLAKIYNERIDLYKKYSDYEVKNDTDSIIDAVNKICEILK
ncbi:MAG: shikimate dehydrogenase [Gammaproteobacteria bacterium]|nr:shikimate dehydrogenase [Gammaproteobacteria bacterium]